jgi:type VI secretion system secreted protein VgrG
MDGSLAPVIRGTTVVPHTLEIPMPEKLGQTERVAELITPLGKDVLALVRFEGTEGLGELFDYHVDALSKQENIDFDKALGQGCALRLDAYRSKTRSFHAILVQAQWIGKFEDLHRYRLVLRPWLWLLGHKANCRIFLDKDVKEIIKQIFTDAGFTDFEFRTNGDYDKIEYCVQYRETDLAFVCRLMELYGIYYFFEHAEGKHTLVLADMRSSHKAVSDLPKVPLLPLGKSQLRGEPHLHDWISERRFRTGKVEFNDYDYLKPTKNLRAPSEASEKYAHSRLEVYDFPGKYDEEEKGKKLSRFRLEAEQALDHRRIIQGDAASLYPGGLVTVEKHPTKAENREYLIVRCRHNFSGHHYLSASQPEPAAPSAPGAKTDRPQVYEGLYEFQPSDRPFRMLPLTPKPRIHGIQTAKVVGKKGEEKEEISTDEHGRIWVQFFWDREPKLTCPIRVAHVWASKRWGGIFIPRIGMEVVVEFLEGDPDRPLVVGAVYNGDNRVPYKLPDNKTVAGWKSDSSKGGNGYNELIFEDKKGSEDIRMHAEKDHHVTVRHAQTYKIGEAFTPPKGSASRTATLENGDDCLTIKMGDQTISIPMGSQRTTARLTISHTVGMTTVTLTPASESTTSPVINRTAQATINDKAGAVINLTAPLINIQGMVLINGMVPLLLPA